MGKGDRKTKRGKIAMGTFGVRRPRKRTEAYDPSTSEKKEKKKSTKSTTAKKKTTKKAEKKS